MDAPAPAVAVSGTATYDYVPHFSHPEILRVLSGILLCIVLAAIDQTVVIPAVPAMAAELHGFSHVAWIVAAYLLTSTAVTPIYGKLSDMHGRRALLMPAIALFVGASVLCGLCQTMWQLILARALQGIGGGGLMAMAQAAIADVVAPRERGKYQGYVAGAWAVASIAGPVLGGWVTDQLSWRWIFWANVPIGIAAFMLCQRGLSVLPVRGGGGRIDYLGAALLAVATGACLMVLSWGGNVYPWLSAPILALVLLVVALVGLLVWHERRAADPLLPPRLFGNSEMVRGILIAALATAGTFGAIFLLPLLFQLMRGADAARAGTLVVPYLASTTVGAYSAGQLARWLGRCRPILLGGLTIATSGFVLLALEGGGAPEWELIVAMAVMGLGIGSCMPTSLVVVQNSVRPVDVGVATGSVLFLRSIGGAFGSTLGGAILANRFQQMVAREGLTGQVNLAALRGPAAKLHLDAAMRAGAHAALSGGFTWAFAALAVLLVAGLAVALGMRDIPLRSGEAH
jgi:EmrB/QacA subfamily drug resistance transporter